MLKSKLFCCSFDDLKAGLAYLKRKRGTQHEGPLAFVKANLTTFMDCQDTLAGNNDKIKYLVCVL